MADEHEEIIIIEESDAVGVEITVPNDDDIPTKSPLNKKKILLIAGAVGLLLAAGGITFALLSHSGEELPKEEHLISSKDPQEPKIEP
ncbi:MAG: hypothetical protein Q7T91_02010, partial [Sulfuricurvum sp.]|nr:hypothetical protein [Sulfuricurvum sp.]